MKKFFTFLAFFLFISVVQAEILVKSGMPDYMEKNLFEEKITKMKNFNSSEYEYLGFSKRGYRCPCVDYDLIFKNVKASEYCTINIYIKLDLFSGVTVKTIEAEPICAATLEQIIRE